MTMQELINFYLYYIELAWASFAEEEDELFWSNYVVAQRYLAEIERRA